MCSDYASVKEQKTKLQGIWKQRERVWPWSNYFLLKKCNVQHNKLLFLSINIYNLFFLYKLIFDNDRRT